MKAVVRRFTVPVIIAAAHVAMMIVGRLTGPAPEVGAL